MSDSHDDVASTSTPPPTPSHGAPPAPLVEEKPARTNAAAAWVPGYWTWTGTDWGWIAGFWRDGEIPAPRVEMPGASPQLGAIWIGGSGGVSAAVGSGSRAAGARVDVRFAP